MTQTSAPVSLNGSRLVRFLSDLDVADVEVSHKHFTERLSRLIDLADSVTLSSAHGKLADLDAVAMDSNFGQISDSLIAEYLRVRKSIVQFIIDSFVAGTGATWLKLPTANAKATADELLAYEPYQQFYLTHQREIAFKIKRLQTTTRGAISGTSAKLTQLAALDTALDETLTAHSRKLFSSVPLLMGKRFAYLYQQYKKSDQASDDPQQWLQADAWLGQFYTELQDLLFAELEIRLQPVLGLIEALNEEVDRTS